MSHEVPLPSPEELAEFYRESHKSVTPISLCEIIAMFRASKARFSERHTDTLKQHLSALSKALGDVPLTSITVRQIDAHLRTYNAPKTQQNHRISIVSLFNYARDKDYLPLGVPTAAERSDSASVGAAVPQILSFEEMQDLLTYSGDPRTTVWLVLGAFAGLRSAEILRLKWKNILPSGIVLDTHITKTKRRRIAEMNDTIWEWLHPLRGSDNQLISYENSSVLYYHIRDLCSRCGVVIPHNALRHSFVSYHLELHLDKARTAKTAGHSEEMLETIYLKLVSRVEAIRWFSLFPNLCQPPSLPKSESTPEKAAA